ncbi:MAG: P-loop NTPase family protein [Cyanobacteria bacterium J06641_5]
MVAQLETAQPNSKGRLLQYQLRGLLQVFTGEQRNFFTGVIAQALAIAAHGTPVLVVQFLKGGIRQGCDRPVRMGQNLDWLRCNLTRHIDSVDVSAEERDEIARLWAYTQKTISEGQYALVVLDELALAAEFGLISLPEVLDFLQARPQHVDLILTGPQVPTAILEMADQITEVRRSYLP